MNQVILKFGELIIIGNRNCDLSSFFLKNMRIKRNSRFYNKKLKIRRKICIKRKKNYFYLSNFINFMKKILFFQILLLCLFLSSYPSLIPLSTTISSIQSLNDTLYLTNYSSIFFDFIISNENTINTSYILLLPSNRNFSFKLLNFKNSIKNTILYKKDLLIRL